LWSLYTAARCCSSNQIALWQLVAFSAVVAHGHLTVFESSFNSSCYWCQQASLLQLHIEQHAAAMFMKHTHDKQQQQQQQQHCVWCSTSLVDQQHLVACLSVCLQVIIASLVNSSSSPADFSCSWLQYEGRVTERKLLPATAAAAVTVNSSVKQGP